MGLRFSSPQGGGDQTAWGPTGGGTPSVYVMAMSGCCSGDGLREWDWLRSTPRPLIMYSFWNPALDCVTSSRSSARSSSGDRDRSALPGLGVAFGRFAFGPVVACATALNMVLRT